MVISLSEGKEDEHDPKPGHKWPAFGPSETPSNKDGDTGAER
jgi:hypothetical protein